VPNCTKGAQNPSIKEENRTNPHLKVANLVSEIWYIDPDSQGSFASRYR